VRRRLRLPLAFVLTALLAGLVGFGVGRGMNCQIQPVYRKQRIARDVMTYYRVGYRCAP
jgi:hypothetical protein